VATGKRDIYCDLTNQAFVRSQRDSTRLASLPGAFHQDKLYLAIHPLEIDPTRTAIQGPYSELDPTGWSASVKIFKTSDATVLASQTVWAVSGTSLVGTLDLNTAAMATEFPASPLTTTTITAILEVELTDGNGSKFTFQDTAFVIKREYITAGSPVAVGAARYYTTDEINAMFVRFSGNPDGATITLSKGSREVVLGAGTDGDAQANAV
jgi:hypothetical protein